MKNQILAIEQKFLDLPFIRHPILMLDRMIRRILWLWGRIRFGAHLRDRGFHCVCHWNADLKYPENIKLGNDVVIGVNVSIGAHSRVEIRDHVRISRDVMIETAGLDFSALEPPYAHTSKPIVINQGVWIGARAMILAGVTIGEYCIVAAGAVVTKNMPPYSLVGGIPARVIARLKVDETDI